LEKERETFQAIKDKAIEMEELLREAPSSEPKSLGDEADPTSPRGFLEHLRKLLPQEYGRG
jgi:hypothetical protein